MTLLVTLVLAALAVPGVALALRGEGTMQVRQTEDCSGNGNLSVVSLPFSLFFDGFAPHDTGTVTGFTQPGNVQVGQGTVTVDENGFACLRVTGHAEPGQYKIVYDFGSGTGKQKVIRLVGPGPTETTEPSPSESATSPSDSPTSATPTTPTATETTPTATVTSPSVTPTSSMPTLTPPPPTDTSAPTSTSAPASTSGTATGSVSATASPTTDVAHLKFKQVPTGAGGEQLPKTGGSGATLVFGATLLVAGAVVASAARVRG